MAFSITPRRHYSDANPAEPPVKQSTKFEFVINLKAAKQIGITIPYELPARANQMIK